MKMKTMKMVLLAFVLLATACSQSTTTPTTPPAITGYSIDSTYYFKINFNGQTLYDYGVKENTLGILMHYPGGFIIQPVVGTNLYNLNANNAGNLNLYYNSGNVSFQMLMIKNGTSIGVYDSLFNNAPSAFEITDLNTATRYDADPASIAVTVQSIDVLNSKINGVMSGNLKNGSALIPFTGSFCLKKIL
jgi:hypothetical protein